MQGLAHVTVPDVSAVSCLVVETLRRHLEADVYFLPKQLDEQVSPVSNSKKQSAATGILICLALGCLSTITHSVEQSNSEDFPSVCQDVYARMSASSFATERASPGAHIICGRTWTLRSCRPITSGSFSSRPTVSRHQHPRYWRNRESAVFLCFNDSGRFRTFPDFAGRKFKNSPPG